MAKVITARELRLSLSRTEIPLPWPVLEWQGGQRTWRSRSVTDMPASAAPKGITFMHAAGVGDWKAAGFRHGPRTAWRACEEGGDRAYRV